MARVLAVYLPSGKSGRKQGVDDFLASGHSVDDLLYHATTGLKDLPRETTRVSEEADTQAAKLVAYAEEAFLFRTPRGKAYVAFPVFEDNGVCAEDRDPAA